VDLWHLMSYNTHRYGKGENEVRYKNNQAAILQTCTELYLRMVCSLLIEHVTLVFWRENIEHDAH
jgi:hypothetical protein